MKFKYYSGIYKVEFKIHRNLETEQKDDQLYLSRTQAKVIFEMMGNDRQNQILNITSIEAYNKVSSTPCENCGSINVRKNSSDEVLCNNCGEEENN